MGREAVAPLGIAGRAVLVVVWVDDLVEEEVGHVGYVVRRGRLVVVLVLFGPETGHLGTFVVAS